ncbi:MAG: group II intron reverse transcriptase/maturase [Bacteroides sp.]|nr:group II intron reverse transcriptase/maturase [Bacteroides sp.]
MNREPEKILNRLAEYSENRNYKFKHLYPILLNQEMYYVAYQRIHTKPGNMTPGIDGKTMDQMSLDRIEELITSLKDESYRPQPSKRIYIPKKNGKTRPIGIPAFNDKLLQEVVRMILEAIYEGQFDHTSHGFRPKRSCHTALAQVQKTFSGVKWFIEGDIKDFFNHISHEILMEILKEQISDDRFISLIRKMLKAGYIKDCKFHNSDKGVPQGNIVSPILANIYLDKLDKFMKLNERVSYVRYADDFLIGIMGSKPNAIHLKEEIKNFLHKKLSLELSDEKTLITHAENAAKFLGYEIGVRQFKATPTKENGVLRHTSGKKKRLTIEKDGVRNKFKQKNPIQNIDTDNGGSPTYHPRAISLVNRLKTETCELCGRTNKLVMHHVRKLKDLQDKTPWGKQMMIRKQKTIALCGHCQKRQSGISLQQGSVKPIADSHHSTGNQRS